MSFVPFALDTAADALIARNRTNIGAGADRLRTRGGVLVIPAAHFGVEEHIRITHGIEPTVVDTALRLAKVLGDLREAAH